jgi:hypothetical protein
MARHSKRKLTLDEPAKKVLAALLREFRDRNFGMEELQNTYQGLSPANLRSLCCMGGGVSDLDFELALKELDESDLVKTGPMELYENQPGSLVMVTAFYSKNEYSYLTEEGYKVATRMGSATPSITAVPRVHISGGTFHQSPIGIGAQVSQAVNISASLDELFTRLRGEICERVIDDTERAEIILRLDELAEARDKSSKIERYKKLLGVVADHVTVLEPLLTLLFQRLMGN